MIRSVWSVMKKNDKYKEHTTKEIGKKQGQKNTTTRKTKKIFIGHDHVLHFLNAVYPPRSYTSV